MNWNAILWGPWWALIYGTWLWFWILVATTFAGWTIFWWLSNSAIASNAAMTTSVVVLAEVVLQIPRIWIGVVANRTLWRKPKYRALALDHYINAQKEWALIYVALLVLTYLAQAIQYFTGQRVPTALSPAGDAAVLLTLFGVFVWSQFHRGRLSGREMGRET